MNAGPEIATQVYESSGKLTLSCNVSAPHLIIRGHKWVYREEVVKQDENSDAVTSYT